MSKMDPAFKVTLKYAIVVISILVALFLLVVIVVKSIDNIDSYRQIKVKAEEYLNSSEAAEAQKVYNQYLEQNDIQNHPIDKKGHFFKEVEEFCIKRTYNVDRSYTEIVHRTDAMQFNHRIDDCVYYKIYEYFDVTGERAKDEYQLEIERPGSVLLKEYFFADENHTKIPCGREDSLRISANNGQKKLAPIGALKNDEFLKKDIVAVPGILLGQIEKIRTVKDIDEAKLSNFHIVVDSIKECCIFCSKKNIFPYNTTMFGNLS